MIFSIISEEDIFNYYISEKFQYEKPFRSPLRKDDIPSFSISKKYGTPKYHDFATGETGNCIEFVKRLFDINYIEAINRIGSDFGLTNSTKVFNRINRKRVSSKLPISKSKINIGVKYLEWNSDYFSYWDQFGITMDTLLKYRVYPISYVFFNGYPIKTPFAFVYLEQKEKDITYKIYQPLESRENKWFNNNDYSVWEGWNQVSDYSDVLIWTKSRKDTMSIVSTTDYSAIACQAESVVPKSHIVDQLRNKSKQLILLYDNDFDKEENWGLNHVKKLSEKFNIPYILIPEEYQCKDYSDLVKKYGKEKASLILKELIERKS